MSLTKVEDFETLEWIVTFIPLVVGMTSILLPSSRMSSRAYLDDIIPAGWVFSVVWFLLYFLIGFSWALAGADDPWNIAMYAILVALLFIWPITYEKSYYYAFYLLYLTQLLVIFLYTHVVQEAKYCLVPLIVWLFAAIQFNYTTLTNR